MKLKLSSDNPEKGTPSASTDMITNSLSTSQTSFAPLAVTLIGGVIFLSFALFAIITGPD